MLCLVQFLVCVFKNRGVGAMVGHVFGVLGSHSLREGGDVLLHGFLEQLCDGYVGERWSSGHACWLVLWLG